MSIIDDYKQLQMIENIKKIQEMKLCYKQNLELCKQLSLQIDKLAKCIEEIEKIAKQQCVCGVNCQDMKMILQKISEVSK